MSVLVKGMEMPLYATRNGEKDTIYQCAVVVHKDNTAELVVCRESAYPFANCNEAHIDKYPLIEVQTPHGRLIDAGAVEERLQKYWYEEYPNQEASYHRAFMDSNACVKDLPTIIEAEFKMDNKDTSSIIEAEE